MQSIKLKKEGFPIIIDKGENKHHLKLCKWFYRQEKKEIQLRNKRTLSNKLTF